MKILLISKYPPIEGGTSSENYWMAKALGARGHEVYVVTNAWEASEEYRSTLHKKDKNFMEPRNVRVFSTFKKPRMPILKSDYFSERLISLAIQVSRKYRPDIIYSHYMIPYGLVGYVTKKITGLPHVARNAGSDVGILYNHNAYKPLMDQIFKDADMVIGGKMTRDICDKLGILQRCSLDPLVDTNAFSPSSSIVTEVPTFTFLGKISRLKKTMNFLEAAAVSQADFKINLVVGKGSSRLKEFIDKKDLSSKCRILDFLPPWRIPDIMRESDCIVCPESDENPYLPRGIHYPKIAREAMACGRCVIIGRRVAQKGIYRDLQHMKDAVVVDPEDIESFRNIITELASNPSLMKHIGENACSFSRTHERPDHIVSSILKCFQTTISTHKGLRKIN